MNPFKTLCLATKESFEVTVSGTQGITKNISTSQIATFSIVENESSLAVDFSNCLSFTAQLASLECLFVQKADLKKVTLINPHPDFKNRFGINSEVTKSSFLQIPTLWSSRKDLAVHVDQWTCTQDIVHPQRPSVQPGEVLYRRFTPSIGKVASLRVLDLEKDLDLFVEWQNKPRVAHFWELAQSKEELKKYLEKGLQDRHQFPAIYELDGIPVGYYEVYWVKEDRLGPYYDSEGYDRGFHLLVGNDEYLGFKNTDAMLKAVCHALYLLEVRTRRIMAEPRHDNVAILKYVETFKAWRKVKEFDFPHKRAALLECSREKFFAGDYLA